MVTVNDFTKIDSGRFCIHFLNLNIKSDDIQAGTDLNRISNLYNMALARFKPIGGKKYHNKKYGGGVAFYTNNLELTIEKINQTLTFL
jgi:hypothetical protein